MVMDANKSRILIAVTLIICLCSLCTAASAGVSLSPRKRASNSSVYEQLEKIVNLSALTTHTPISSAIEILRNSTEPALNIVVLWRDLSENALIQQDTPICMDGVSAIRLRTGLELLLRAVSSSPGALGYVVQDGVIVIATNQSLPRKRVTRIYDIRDLAAPPANYRFGLPVVPFGPAAPGFGGGWPGQGPIGAFGGAWGTYGRSIGQARRGTNVYEPGWPSRRVDDLANLITSVATPHGQ